MKCSRQDFFTVVELGIRAGFGGYIPRRFVGTVFAIDMDQVDRNMDSIQVVEEVLWRSE
jgi:hypothetical protein